MEASEIPSSDEVTDTVTDSSQIVQHAGQETSGIENNKVIVFKLLLVY